MVFLVSKETEKFPDFILHDLSVVWLDDPKMAEANWRHLRHRGATDILTFDYAKGMAEIIISLDTARQNAAENHQTFEQELTLYLAHGILHLAGLRDKTSPQKRRMRREESWLTGEIKK